MDEWVTDFQQCTGEDGLKKVLAGIDRLGYLFSAATQSGDVYTIFFRRPRNG